MGLIMLILIGIVPTAYALNRAMPESEMQTFATTSQTASVVIEEASGNNVLGNPRPAVTAPRAQRVILLTSDRNRRFESTKILV
jgi:inorganic phosphate transporter, PiT family